jgi:hypothetical protein
MASTVGSTGRAMFPDAPPPAVHFGIRAGRKSLMFVMWATRVKVPSPNLNAFWGAWQKAGPHEAQRRDSRTFSSDISLSFSLLLILGRDAVFSPKSQWVALLVLQERREGLGLLCFLLVYDRLKGEAEVKSR